MNRSKTLDIAIYIGLIVIFLAPRLPGIDSFVTLDEPQWLSMGANYYYALGQREFENTVYEYQPAVTTMSIIAFAMFLYFPEYRGLGQGYLDYEKGLLDPFMLKHGYDPLVLLGYARTIQVFVLLVVFLLIYFLLQKFLPKWAAVFAAVFISFEPYYLGLTRMLTHEAMVAFFVLASLLSFYIYIAKDRRMIFLLISGVMAGLAQLSKSSAIAMLAGVGVLLLYLLFQNRKGGWGSALISALKPFAIWFVVLVVTYVVLWPGMWVAPGKMLYQVYGNAFSYAFQGARLTVTEDLNVSQFDLDATPNSVWDVARVFFFRTTPLTWLGMLALAYFLFIRREDKEAGHWLLPATLLANGIAFILLIGLAQGRNSPHYILSSYVSFGLLAALGWGNAFRSWMKSEPLRTSAHVAVVLFQVASALAFFPYYFTYRNPVLYAAGWYNDYPQKPYCEGLETAAQYLAELPDASESTVLSYYGRGCVSYFYPGETIGFRPYYVDGNHAEDLLANLNASDYLVVYYANQVQMPKYDAFLTILSEVEPLHVVWMDGYEYVRIYKIEAFPPEIFERLADL